jgi:hypothetical protein
MVRLWYEEGSVMLVAHYSFNEALDRSGVLGFQQELRHHGHSFLRMFMIYHHPLQQSCQALLQCLHSLHAPFWSLWDIRSFRADLPDIEIRPALLQSSLFPAEPSL